MKFSELANTYDQIAEARNDAARVKLLSDAFKRADRKSLAAIAHFSIGELVPPELNGQLGIGPGAIRKRIAELARKDTSKIDDEVRETGDMSEIAARYADGRDSLKVDELWQMLQDTIRKDKSRPAMLEKIFTSTTSVGAKYFTRMALNQMRLNVGLGTMTRSIAKAFDVSAKSVEHIYAMTNDIGLAAVRASKGEKALEHTGIELFHPYQFMNAHKVDDPNLIIPTGKTSKKNWILETKYDGIRLQIHIRKKPWKVTLYSRRLNDDAGSMPDVVEAVKKSWRGGDAIIEGEAVAFDPSMKKRLPFQAVLQRFGRKHSVAKMVDEIPLVLYLFDVLYDNGKSLFDVTQKDRRARLEKIIHADGESPDHRVKGHKQTRSNGQILSVGGQSRTRRNNGQGPQRHLRSRPADRQLDEAQTGVRDTRRRHRRRHLGFGPAQGLAVESRHSDPRR